MQSSSSLLFLLLVIVAVGALIPVQTALNAIMGQKIGEPAAASLVVFAVGIIFFVVISAWRRSFPLIFANASQVPWYAWPGGLLGAIYIFALVVLAPRVGIGLTTAAVLFGQLVTGLAIDHFGVLGAPQIPMNWPRAAGALLIALGIRLLMP